ncbi:hypothetical protein EC890511_2271, partial [Escherichia coli 89.0511]
MPEAD